MRYHHARWWLAAVWLLLALLPAQGHSTAQQPAPGRRTAVAPLAVRINFQPADVAVPAGYLADSGAAFGDRGNGYSYGWSGDNRASARARNAANSPDQRYDTLVHMQLDGWFRWEIALPSGSYDVRVVAGDPSYYDSIYQVNLEGRRTIDGVPTSASRWLEGRRTLTVADGTHMVTKFGLT